MSDINVPITSSKCYEVDPLSDPRWTELVENHPRSSIFHTARWLRALRSAYGYAPIVLTTCAPHGPLTNGLVFCNIKSWVSGRRLVSLPFSDHCEPLVNNGEEFEAIMSYAKKMVDEKKHRYLEIRPISLASQAISGLTPASVYLSHQLDLRLPLEKLLSKFHKDCVLRKIRRAEREELKYQEGVSGALLREFYRLLLMTRRRHGLPPQPIGWFQELLASFGDGIKIRVAFKDSHAVASILTLSHKKSMVYKYGCSDANFNKFGGMALLFHRAILDAKNHGCDEFDMGRSDVDNAGLVAFKEHWGAQGTPIQYWTYPALPRRLATDWQKHLADRVVPFVPDFVLEMIGQTLYKHIG